MYPTTLTPISDGVDDHSYDIRKYEGAKSVRVDTGLPWDVPCLLTISHQETGAGDNLRVSSLVRFDQTVKRASDGALSVVPVQLVVRYNPTIASEGLVKALIMQLGSFLSSGRIDQLLKKEI